MASVNGRPVPPTDRRAPIAPSRSRCSSTRHVDRRGFLFFKLRVTDAIVDSWLEGNADGKLVTDSEDEAKKSRRPQDAGCLPPAELAAADDARGTKRQPPDFNRRHMVCASEREVAHVDQALGGRRVMGKRLGAGVLAVLGLSLILAACGGSSSTAQAGGGTPTAAAGTPGPAAAGGGSGASAAAGGADGFEGSLASSGLYSANWTVPTGADANPFNAAANPTMSSDKGTFGNITVKPDGSISFGSAASELNANSLYSGTGAKVTLDATGQFVCAFTVDSDLKGNHDGAVLHMSGGLTVRYHMAGDLNCP